MKKKILSVLLAVMFIFGAAAPAVFAQETESQSTVNWDEFYAEAPEKTSYKVNHGETVTLAANANIPQGVEVAYQWLYIVGSSGSRRVECTESTLTVAPGVEGYPKEQDGMGADAEYYCQITATQKDSDGNVVEKKTIYTEHVKITVKMKAIKKVTVFFTKPLENAINATLLMVGMSFGVFLPISPIIFVVSIVASIIGCFRYVIAH